MIISQLLQSLAHRLRQSLTKINDLELRENLVTQLMENVQRTASYLLDDFQVQSCDEDSLKILGRAEATFGLTNTPIYIALCSQLVFGWPFES